MIEIHSHLLPRIDDGAKSIDTAVEMIEDMIRNGITGAVATPHHLNSIYVNTFDDVKRHTDELNRILDERDIDFTVYPGQEVRFRDDLLQRIKSHEIRGLNRSRYILIEFPIEKVPLYSINLLSDLRVDGFIPVIAHPERVIPIQNDIRILRDFINAGCLAQLTASSIISPNQKLKKASREMIEDGLISFISSDNHDAKGSCCCMKKVMAKIENLYGSEMREYFIDNSRKLINDEIVLLRKKDDQRKSFLRRLLRF